MAEFNKGVQKCNTPTINEDPEKKANFERARELEVVRHVMTEHGPAVHAASELLSPMHKEVERITAVYNEAIGINVREGAPLASYSIDRKCLRKGAEATAGDNVQALVCFFGALASCPQTIRARARGE